MNYFTKFFSKLLNCFPKKSSYKWIDYDYVYADKSVLRECTCASSHNSTLDDLQILGTSSTDALIRVLNLNFRMIELDIFKHHDNNIPVVSHGNSENNLQVTSSIPFEDCLDNIVEYAWKCTNLPLFLALEINTDDDKVLSDIDELIIKYLGDRIMYEKDEDLWNHTIEQLSNKIIIFSTRDGSSIYSTLYNSDHILNISSNRENYKIDKLVRVYPSNIVLSSNYDWQPFIDRGCHFVSINVGYQDDYYRDYIDYFDGKGIKKMKIENKDELP